MEKILMKKIFRCQFYLALAAMLIIGTASWQMVKHHVYHEMSQVLDHEESSYFKIQDLILQIPTTHDNALFAVEPYTGKLLGKAVGNDLLDASESSHYNWEELSEIFRNSEKGKIIQVQGMPAFLMTREINHILFVDVRLAVSQIRQIFWTFLGLLLMNAAIASLAVLVVKRYFHKYVFSEIDAIQQTITQLVSGDETVEFHTDRNTELSAIAVALNAWNRNIRHTQKKLNWVIRTTAPDAAMFECLSYVNTVYYSDNLRSMLGMDQKHWDTIKDDTKQFRAYFSALDSQKDDHGIVALGDKFLLLQLYQMDEDYFGILVNKTNSVRRRRQQATDLRRAIDNSEEDSLTGLLNRRGFEAHAGRAFADGAANAVMLMMDIDNFKQVNDALGHPEGDLLLRKVGNCLKQQFRENDLVARMGGDEFTVFLTGITDRTLLKKLDSLMTAIQETLAEYSAYDTTISIGAARVSGKTADFSTLYEHADKALYQAKRSGKNHYEFFTQQKPVNKEVIG